MFFGFVKEIFSGFRSMKGVQRWISEILFCDNGVVLVLPGNIKLKILFVSLLVLVRETLRKFKVELWLINTAQEGKPMTCTGKGPRAMGLNAFCRNVYTGEDQEKNKNPLFLIVQVQFPLPFPVPFPCSVNKPLNTPKNQDKYSILVNYF